MKKMTSTYHFIHRGPRTQAAVQKAQTILVAEQNR